MYCRMILHDEALSGDTASFEVLHALQGLQVSSQCRALGLGWR